MRMLRTSVVLVSVCVTPCAGSTCAGATLFFSQYQDDGAPGLNKYYQIFNPTSAAIHLADEYSIATCANGCSSSAGAFEYGYTFRGGAIIAAGGTYTLCNEGLDETTECDEVLQYPRVSYSGNDLLALIWGTDHRRATVFDVVDRIGRFTTELHVPSWTVCGEASRIVAADVLLMRAAETCCGSGGSDGAFALNWPAGEVCEWTDRKTEGWVRPWAKAGAPCAAALVRPPSPPAPPPPPPAPTCISLQCDAGARCGMCLVAIARDECRTEWHSDQMLHSCDTIFPGDFCEADGECGTSNINNCPGRDADDLITGLGADIYKRLACTGSASPSPPPMPPRPPPPPPLPPLSCSDPACDAGASCGYCLQLVQQRECPRPSANGVLLLRSCDVAAVDEVCEGSGECGTNPAADNCRGPDTPGQPFSWRDQHSDVYRVRPCVGSAAVVGESAGAGAGAGAIATAVFACLLLALLAMMASLGHPVACPQWWVAFIRRKLSKLQLNQANPSAAAVIETSSNYVAPLAANDSAAVSPSATFASRSTV